MPPPWTSSCPEPRREDTGRKERHFDGPVNASHLSGSGPRTSKGRVTLSPGCFAAGRRRAFFCGAYCHSGRAVPHESYRVSLRLRALPRLTLRRRGQRVSEAAWSRRPARSSNKSWNDKSWNERKANLSRKLAGGALTPPAPAITAAPGQLHQPFSCTRSAAPAVRMRTSGCERGSSANANAAASALLTDNPGAARPSRSHSSRVSVIDLVTARNGS